MFTIKCDKCSGNLVMDMRSTMNNYIKDDWKYEIDIDTGKLIEDSIQKYLIYTCKKCGTNYKFTYKEWEKRYRKELATQIMEIKKMKVFRTLNPAAIKEENGIEFCGQCSGYAGDGYCLVDIIKQCSIRKS